MRKHTLRGFALALCFSATLPASAAETASIEQQQQMLDQLAQLDELDHQDFLVRNDKANACVQQQDFDCAEKYIGLAKRVARTSADKAALQMTRDNLAMERELIASEARSRRQQQEAEEEDRRAQERAVRAQELAEEREAERQRVKYAAAVAGFALGGGGQLSPERQAAVLQAIAQDSQSEGGDMSNFNDAVNGIRQDQQRQSQERENLRAQQRELQQRQQQVQAQAREQAQQEQAQARQQIRQQQAQQLASAAPAEAAPSRPQVQIVQYVPQTVTIPAFAEQCPPGSSPARHANGRTLTAGSGAAVCLPDAKAGGQSATGGQNGAGNTVAGSTGSGNGSAGSANGSGSGSGQGNGGGTAKKSKWGDVQPELLAICREGTNKKGWECNGGQDNQILADEPLDRALERQHCAGGTLTVGGPVIKGQQWQVYQCGKGVGPGDFDVAKRYNLVTPRRSYICEAYKSGRCTIPYTGQDKQ